MGLSVSDKLAFIREYKKQGGKGNYLSAIKQYELGGEFPLKESNPTVEASNITPDNNVFPYNGESKYKGGYDIKKAREIYEPDETGHLPSVDYRTGEWLKDKDYPTAWKEFYETQTNPELYKQVGFPIQNERGRLQYIKGYRDGGETTPTQGIPYQAPNPWQQTLPKQTIQEKPQISTKINDLIPIPVSKYPIEQSTTAVVNPYEDADIRAENSIYFKKQIEKKVTPKKEVVADSLIDKYTTIKREEQKNLTGTYYKKYKHETKEDVKKIQKTLINSGYTLPKYGVDGYWGDETEKAYSSYIKNLEKTEKSDIDLQTEWKKCKTDLYGCAEYVSEVTNNAAIGDAWTMYSKLKNQGKKTKFNVYTDPRFKNVDNAEDLLKTTKEVRRDKVLNTNLFKVGDAVGLFWSGSDQHAKALKEGKDTYNTHVGVVTGFKDGMPIISHNIHGKVLHAPANKLPVVWIAESGLDNVPVFNDKDKPKDNNVFTKVDYFTKKMTKDLGVNAPIEQVISDVEGILRVESNLGTKSPTKEDIAKSRLLKTLLRKPSDYKNVSVGAAKIKLNSLSLREQKFLNVDSSNIENIDNSIKVLTYLYLKHYSTFNKYAEKNKQLNLSKEDVRDMTILSHNQGTDKLLNLGYNNDNLTIEQEVDKLRKLKSGKVFDISSTKYRYLPPPLNILGYLNEFPKGHDTYVSRVRKWGKSYEGKIKKTNSNN